VEESSLVAPWAIAVLLCLGGGALTAGSVTAASGQQPSGKQSAQKPPPKKAPSKAAAAISSPPVFESTGELQRFGVRIVSPTSTDEIVGRVSVRAEVATDRPSAVAAVDFFIDGRLLFSDAEAPYELLWSSGGPAAHVIEVQAHGPGRQMVSDVLRTSFVAPASGLGGYSARVERVEMHVRVEGGDPLPAEPATSTFQVYENGVEQPVVSVERVADLPLAVGLLIDHSESMLSRLETALDAAGAFVDGLLRHPNDKAFVLGFASVPIVFQEFTNDSERLAESISLIDDGTYTALYDSIVVAARRFEGIDGRRAAILLTDGADSGSDHTFQDAVAAAQRADVALYPVAVDLSPRFWRERWILGELAKRTGGRLFSLGRHTDPQGIYEAIEKDLRAQFRISYAPIIAGGDGEWRDLEIRLRGPDGVDRRVRTRPGYFAQ
jgi:Ca-activated chloride channel family protein